MADSEKFTLAKAKAITELLENHVNAIDLRVTKIENETSCKNKTIDDMELTLFGNQTANFPGLVKSVQNLESKIDGKFDAFAIKMQELMTDKTKRDTRTSLILGVITFIGFPTGAVIMYMIIHWFGIK